MSEEYNVEYTDCIAPGEENSTVGWGVLLVFGKLCDDSTNFFTYSEKYRYVWNLDRDLVFDTLFDYLESNNMTMIYNPVKGTKYLVGIPESYQTHDSNDNMKEFCKKHDLADPVHVQGLVM